ncbi:MAG TPA: hypothetical protein VKV95_21905 [Terriglobia bacterium]|nr:hypothetical protein [Terriglobia bacterium]
MAHEPQFRRRHNQNADGPFYVVNGECISCGAPEMRAPNLMAHDSRGHCFFIRQPATAEETNEAILSTWASCCGALRYGGENREALIRLAELGLAEQCDFRLKDEPEPLSRSRVSFEFAEAAKVGVACAEEITKYLAEYLEKPGHGSGRVRSLRLSGPNASLVYEWGVQPDRYHVTFAVEPRPHQRRWAILLSRKDGHPKTGFAILVHEALLQDSRFRSIQWHTDDEWQTGANNGRSLPY